MDRLGESCRDGKESAEYLWRVPHDEEVRRKILGLLGRAAPGSIVAWRGSG
jgi:hypothetical protein